MSSPDKDHPSLRGAAFYVCPECEATKTINPRPGDISLFEIPPHDLPCGWRGCTGRAQRAKAAVQ